MELAVSKDEYGCTVEELRSLMEYRSQEAKEKIDELYGGIDGLCKRLKTDPATGVPADDDELARRRAVFGANEIPGRMLSPDRGAPAAYHVRVHRPRDSNHITF